MKDHVYYGNGGDDAPAFLCSKEEDGMWKCLWLLCVTVLVVSNQASAGMAVFTCDFESGLTGTVATGVSAEFSGITLLESSQGYSAYGFGETFLFNGTYDATTLTLTGLPDHIGITVVYDLAVVNSWDGDTTDFGPDYFNMTIDGVTAFHESLRQGATDRPMSFTPTASQILFDGDNCYSGPGSGHAATPDAGYSIPGDITEYYDHSEGTASIAWYANGAGYQGFYYGTPNDEAWAIDNIAIILHGTPGDINPVPEPASLSLLAIGLYLARCKVGRRRSR